jgi:hypothetical protein
MKMKSGNWYRINDRGDQYIGQYMGREKGFECCVCGKGCNAHCFNIWYDKDGGYETWGFGNDHMPEIIEDLGQSEEVIIGE